MVCKNCESELLECVHAGIITAAQMDAIRSHSTDTHPNEVKKSFNPIMVVYYLGALLILSAFGWFLGNQWQALGPGGILGVSACFAALFAFVGRHLSSQEKFPIAGGLLTTCAVGMVPLATYCAESLLGIWPKTNSPVLDGYHGYYVWINGVWIVIELSTVVASLFALRKIKFSFLVMPMALALWFMSMDITEIILSGNIQWSNRSWVSVICGAVFLVAGFIADQCSKGIDYAFWIYLAGLLAFWGGLTSMPSSSEWGKLVYLIINLGLLALSLKLARKTFAVFGACGVWGYIGHLAWTVFKDSAAFPIVLAFIGLLMILSAVFFQKKYSQMQRWFQA